MNTATTLINASFDLDSLDDASPITHKVGIAFDDDGEPTVGFVVVGKDSTQYREATQRLRIAGIKRGAVKSQRIDTKTDDGATTFDRLCVLV